MKGFRGGLLRSAPLATVFTLFLGSANAGAAPISPHQPPANRDAATVDTAGIRLVTSIVQSRPTSEAQAQALSDALVFAEANPDDVGYPWIDPKTGSLEVSAASARGVTILAAERGALAVTTGVRQVDLPFGKLEAIKHEITTLNAAGMVDADLIYETAPDQQTNSIVVVVSSPSARLFDELATRYGTNAIEVMIDPSGPGGNTASRLYDFSPFFGGARIYANTSNDYCSDSFPWATNHVDGNALITAAHCASTGSTVRIGDTGSPTVGSIAANTEENWNDTTGTTYYQGDTVYRGDAALLRLYSGKAAGAYIYRGPRDTTTASAVVSRLNRYSAYGDQVYVGGQTTGETGPWTVAQVGIDWWYSGDGPNVWIRNANNAPLNPFTNSSCVAAGDSGGSVFSIVSGGVRAAGTLSGYGPNACTMIFTDIYRTYLWLPGDVLLH